MADKRYIDFAVGSSANTQIILTADPTTSALGKLPLSFIGFQYVVDNNNTITADKTINVGNFTLSITATGGAGSALVVNGIIVGITSYGSSIPIWAVNTAVNTNSVGTAVLASSNFGNGGVGHGLSWRTDLEDSVGTATDAGEIQIVWTNATSGAWVSKMDFYLVNTTLARKASLAGSGQWTFDGYGGGTFTGTATKWLAVTAAGLVIEENAPGGSITASNGLRMSTATNVVLGNTSGPGTAITADTYLDLSTNRIFWNTANTNTSFYSFNVQNSAAGGAFGATNSGGGTTANFSNAGIGDALSLSVTSGYGLTANATSGKAARFIVTPSSTNTAVTVIEVRRGSSGTTTAGVGAAIDFYVETDSGNERLTHRIKSNLTTVTDASRVSALVISGVDNAVEADLLTVKGSGQLQAHKYGVGTFTGTEAYKLAVDSSGNIIEVAV